MRGACAVSWIWMPYCPSMGFTASVMSGRDKKYSAAPRCFLSLSFASLHFSGVPLPVMLLCSYAASWLLNRLVESLWQRWHSCHAMALLVHAMEVLYLHAASMVHDWAASLLLFSLFIFGPIRSNENLKLMEFEVKKWSDLRIIFLF